MKALLLSSLLMIMSNSVFAMEDEGRARPDIETLITTLQLDEAQTAELKGLMQQHKQQMDAFRENNRANHTQMKMMRSAHREELLNILTEEQFYQFDNYMRQFHPHPHRDH